VPHTATAADSSWSSGTLAAGGTRWRWVATRKGEWKYRCALHPSMTGVVVIR
jgi:plastocyanin